MLLLIGLVQVPAIAGAGYVADWLGALVATLGMALSAPVARQFMRNPWDHRPRSSLHKNLILWPFYTWWAVCLMFTLVAGPILVANAFLPFSVASALGASLLVAAVGAFRALRPRARVIQKRFALRCLPQAFDGLKVVHITDVHCGPFTPPKLVQRWVARANALRPDLIVVTGDLITSGPDYIDVMAAALAQLKAPLGVFACLGNHDYFGTTGVGAALQRCGVNVLANQGVTLHKSGGKMFLAGVDDNWSGRDDLNAALRERPPNTATVLLAHDPNFFPRSAAAHVDLTLSGHTHGGQFAVPWLVRKFNLAQTMTPFSSGVYRQGNSVLYVNHGLGTSGPPIRLGARPELTLITLAEEPSL